MNTPPDFRGIEQRTNYSGFRPELYTVVTTSYAPAGIRNIDHTSNAAFVDTYWPAQLQNGPSTVAVSTINQPGANYCSFRQNGNWCDFELVITLDKSVNPDPITTGSGEVRIRPYVSGVAGEPASYRNRLPPPDTHYPMQIFDVLPVTQLDVIAGPESDGTSIFLLKAHLLVDGSLALVTQDYLVDAAAVGSIPILNALTAAQIGTDFTTPWNTADTLLRFYIKGSYKSNMGTIGGTH